MENDQDCLFLGGILSPGDLHGTTNSNNVGVTSNNSNSNAVVDNHPPRKQCPYCKTTCKDKRNLDRHLKECHPDLVTNPRAKYLCRENGYPDCKFETHVGSTRRDHQKKHPPPNREKSTPIKEHICNYCDKTMRNKKALENHKLKVHKDQSDPERFFCKMFKNDGVNLCNRRFYDETRLKRHVKQCHQSKKARCPKCFKVFNNTSNLNKHIKLSRCQRTKNPVVKSKEKPRKLPKNQLLCQDPACKGMKFVSAEALDAHRKAVHVVDLTNENGTSNIGDEMDCRDFGQPCTVCGNRAHALKRGHFMSCENKDHLRYEPLHSLFASHLPLNNDSEECLPTHCTNCRHDSRQFEKRHMDWALWQREVHRHETRVFALLPLPENELVNSRAQGNRGIISRKRLKELLSKILDSPTESAFGTNVKEETGQEGITDKDELGFSMVLVRKRGEQYHDA